MTTSAKDKFLNELQHIWIAYSFFEQAVPNECGAPFPMQYGSISLGQPSEVRSLRVQLGWAFFTRLEGCLEALLHRLGIRLSKTQSLLDVCNTRRIELSADEASGLRAYRELRNVLHHADGNPDDYERRLHHINVLPGHEPHLMREHVQSFYQLFRKVGAALAEQGSQE